MGSKGSKEPPPPVHGLPPSRLLSVVPVFRTSLRDSYTVPRVTTLRVRKSSLWSVDSNILDYRGFYVFRKTGSMLSNNLEFRDDAGNEIAFFEKKKKKCSQSVAMVTLPEGRGGPVATLRHHYRGGKSSVGIFLHAAGEEDCDGLCPDIRVRGDLGNHQFRFTMGGRSIAQVQHSPEHGMYTLEIGPWVDIAFITICASAIDLLHTRATLSLLEAAAWCLKVAPCSPFRSSEEERRREEGGDDEEEEDEEEEEEEEEEDIFQFD